jgi:hypothetical protein
MAATRAAALSVSVITCGRARAGLAGAGVAFGVVMACVHLLVVKRI